MASQTSRVFNVRCSSATARCAQEFKRRLGHLLMLVIEVLLDHANARANPFLIALGGFANVQSGAPSTSRIGNDSRRREPRFYTAPPLLAFLGASTKREARAFVAAAFSPASSSTGRNSSRCAQLVNIPVNKYSHEIYMECAQVSENSGLLVTSEVRIAADGVPFAARGSQRSTRHSFAVTACRRLWCGRRCARPSAQAARSRRMAHLRHVRGAPLQAAWLANLKICAATMVCCESI